MLADVLRRIGSVKQVIYYYDEGAGEDDWSAVSGTLTKNVDHMVITATAWGIIDKYKGPSVDLTDIDMLLFDLTCLGASGYGANAWVLPGTYADGTNTWTERARTLQPISPANQRGIFGASLALTETAHVGLYVQGASNQGADITWKIHRVLGLKL